MKRNGLAVSPNWRWWWRGLAILAKIDVSETPPWSPSDVSPFLSCDLYSWASQGVPMIYRGGGGLELLPGHLFISQGRWKALSFSPQDRLYFHHALWPFIYFSHFSPQKYLFPKNSSPPCILMAPLGKIQPLQCTMNIITCCVLHVASAHLTHLVLNVISA